MRHFGIVVMCVSFMLTFILGMTDLGAEKILSKTLAINGYDTVAYFTKGKHYQEINDTFPNGMA